MDEIRSHFALWAIAKSPLFISADLRYTLLRLLSPTPCVSLWPLRTPSHSKTHPFKQGKRKH